MMKAQNRRDPLRISTTGGQPIISTGKYKAIQT